MKEWRDEALSDGDVFVDDPVVDDECSPELGEVAGLPVGKELAPGLREPGRTLMSTFCPAWQ